LSPLATDGGPFGTKKINPRLGRVQREVSNQRIVPKEEVETAMVQRVTDHLANERTFLAWVRTALGMIGLGFVLARMGLFLRQIALTARFQEAVGPAAAASAVRGGPAGHEFIVSGVVFLVIGTFVGAWSGWVYDRNRRLIEADRFEPASWSVMVLTSVVVLGGLVIVGLVLGRMVLAEG
jgi:putative membrane protein